MKVFNQTKFDVGAIGDFPRLKHVKNMWRQRDIILYQHPTLKDSVVSVGITFDRSMMVIAVENKRDWRRELNSCLDTVITE